MIVPESQKRRSKTIKTQTKETSTSKNKSNAKRSRNKAQNKEKNEKSKYSFEALDAQIVCNSVIPQKFGHLLKKYPPSKNIMLGYKDSTIGQIGYRGDGDKKYYPFPKGVRFRWTWDLPSTGKFIKCLIMKDETYRISLESY